MGESIGMIAVAVSSRSSKEDKNVIVFLETGRLQAEEEERIRQEGRAEERRWSFSNDDDDDDDGDDAPRFLGMVSSPPLTQASVTSSMGQISSIWSCYEESQVYKIPFLSFFRF